MAGKSPRVPPLLKLVLRRLAIGFLTLIALSALVFAATQALPGDAAVQVLGPFATQAQIVEMRQRLGLDQPIYLQYLHWILGVLQGDFGTSLSSTDSVAHLLAPRIDATAVLVVMAATVAIPLALLLGIWAAVRRDRAADIVSSGSLLVMASLPEFVIGIGLVALLATTVLQLLPPVSLIDPSLPLLSQLQFAILPAITLVCASIPYVARMMRTSMIEVLDSSYIQMARLNGIPERRVVLVHAFRNAIAPAVQVIALTLTYLAGGVVVVEAVFNYPGIGTALIDAVRYRDLPVVQFLALLIGAIYVVCNLTADLVGILVTPRLRTSL
jgi:peptide/nickel transport system permease protein